MLKINRNIAIITIASILIAKIFLIATKDQTQWTGFFVTAFHIAFIAFGSMYVLREKQ